VHVLDRLVGHLQPVLIFKVGAAVSCRFDHFFVRGEVFRMHSGTHQFERHGHADLKLVDSIELV
jgi:hypothetical protein